MKIILIISIVVVAGIALTLVGCRKSENPDVLSITGCTLTWTHPEITNAPAVEITDVTVVRELSRAFDNAGFLRKDDSTAYDCPMYDLTVTFKRESGALVDVKVYLPRERTFPGMWKHPSSGALSYFEVEKKEPKILVDIVRQYLPKSPVYPEAIADWPPVQFNKGIPDFRKVNLPIFGDFSPDEFKRGR